jgi:hypothetical protein
MANKSNEDFVYKNVYPLMRYPMSLGRKSHKLYKSTTTSLGNRQKTSSVVPDSYTVCNTSTIDSDYDLSVIEGELPQDLDGSLYVCQCLGVPEAFMVGDTNIVKLDFNKDNVHLKNRLMFSPVAIARMVLESTRHRFDYFGLMFLSPGLGMLSYTEGMYLLPDGRLALRAVTPVGKRSEWLPMMSGKAGEAMGNLFAGYSNSHVLYTDHEQGDVFLVNYQYKQDNGEHPVNLIKWDGYNDFESWLVVDEQGQDIEIKQSIHELVFTRDYVILADTAFVAGTEMLTPWVNAPLPYEKTVVYIVDRRELLEGTLTVRAKRVEVDEACIHLISEYENLNDKITLYMLHTPATNTAEILKSYDKNLEGELFSEHLIGYGTLPVLDLSSVGKHIINMKSLTVENSEYISEMPYCWGPYLYTYMGRQIEPFNKQDLFIMFKGFSKDMLPERIFNAYKDVDNRRVPLENMVSGSGISHNNSICRITTGDFKIADAYVMPDKVLLYTISCLTSSENKSGYVIAGVVTDNNHENSSGHEYWLFDAEGLSKGPICKLSHPELNNATIFHTIYIPSDVEETLSKKKVSYHVPLREDYPAEELSKWDDPVSACFEDVIWPYYDTKENRVNEPVENILQELSKRRIKSFGKEYLVGEEFIEDPVMFADQMVEEVDRLLNTPGWKLIKDKENLIVESKPVKGPFESSGINITRASGIVAASADETFAMLISPEGYAVIDPISKPEDHKEPPLECYEWKEGARLEAAVATTKIPMLPEGEFVVLNAIDPSVRTFASKSILHDKSPGGSKYSGVAAPENNKERALNTFAIKVDVISENSCRVLCINYADMAGKTSGSMNNNVNEKFFFPSLYKRIKKEMKNRKKINDMVKVK